MAIAVQKITSLANTRDIPFNKLVLSQANVRRTKAGVSIEDLAEDIGRRGLLQNLNVRPVVDAEGRETGMFEVPAGGRRYRALELIVKSKRLAKTAPVPCNVREVGSPISAEEDSLAENTQRVDLHPLDQFRAFKGLVDAGQAIEDVAARFFVSPAIVRQRLKLASVAPALLDLYADDAITLDQLMAFTVSHDEVRQLQVWDRVGKTYNKDAYTIRRLLTEGSVEASDRRAVFVGVEAYEAAGGQVSRDLFQQDRGGWLGDVALLDRLVAEKLTAEAETVASEGWKWVEAALDYQYGHASGLRRIYGQPPETSAEEQTAHEARTDELECLYATHEGDEDVPDDIVAQAEALEAEIAAFNNRPLHYDPVEIARGGAFVAVDREGRVRVERGFVRPEDEPPAEPMVEGEDSEGSTAAAPEPRGPTTITVAGAPEPEPAEEDEGEKPLPERLLMELTAHRTLALRDAVASHPHVAMTTLLHKLVVDAFERVGSSGACLEASVRHVYLSAQADDLKDSASARSVDERHKGWAADLPIHDDQALWDHLDRLDEASRQALLAHCVSFGVNAVVEKVDRYGGAGLSQHALDRRIAQADRLARAVGLDMAEAGWRPTVKSYLGRTTKGRILEAVREGKGEMAAQLIDHLRKADMAREAERLLADTNWLPEPLRTTGGAEAEAIEGGEPEALPAFLADEDEPAEADLDPEPHAIAAE